MEYDFNIFYYVNTYKKWWKKIVLVIIVSMVLTTCMLYFVPVSYVSTVTVITGSSGKGGGEGALGKLLGLSGLSGGNSSVDIIISMLQSRRMTSDIRGKFKLDEKRNFRYSIATRDISAGMAIDVKGNDPQLTKEIANFAVQNLDKINMELDITPAKPMVKVLDSALNGSPESKKGEKKIILAGMLSFLLMSLYAFFLEYINKIKKN